MGVNVANVGFWADYNPGSPPTGKLIARHHQTSTSVDEDYDVTSSFATIKLAAAEDDVTDFNTEMATHGFWSGLTAGEKQAFWYSAKKLWG